MGSPAQTITAKAKAMGPGFPVLSCSGMSGTPSTSAVIAGKAVTRKHVENTLGNFAILKS
jgi:hypothetical protein